MKTAVIVQARLGSSRLPAKVLLPLPTGRTVLEEVLFRCKQISGVDVVVAAIPDTAENDIVFAVADGHMRQHGGWIVRGPEHDVLARYAKAAEAVGADTVMRVTSDCPLIDPVVCGQVLEAYRAARDVHGNVEYCSNSIENRRTYPQGFDCEVFSRDVLDLANRKVLPYSQKVDPVAVEREAWRRGLVYVPMDVENVNAAANDREHVTPWIIRNAEYRWIVMPNGEDRSHLRWTLDTLADYVHIWRIFEDQLLMGIGPGPVEAA